MGSKLCEAILSMDVAQSEESCFSTKYEDKKINLSDVLAYLIGSRMAQLSVLVKFLINTSQETINLYTTNYIH